ncbi:MAG: aldehyde ferredoxin oxidoreductase [Oscillospiraceae bacterium]|nr:aldehyde ferredoxin oxidoreductase [Oscillospiraceae bacterium]
MPEQMKMPDYGYVGKIAFIDLTERSVKIVPTSNYAPKYIGGRAIATKIYWDITKPGMKALDPENPLMIMTGPTTATGVPTGGRTSVCAMAPNNLPEQFCWGNIGGWLGSELKFAGFDGIVIVGKSPEPTYVMINDEEITFYPAEELWGSLTHDCQDRLKEIHGEGVVSAVIGPAGENLCRNASITTSNDNVAAKAGYGAVMGSKNLKAVTVRGTGDVRPYSVDKLLSLRKSMGNPQRKANPVEHLDRCAFRYHINFPTEPGKVKKANVACSHGCNMRCNLFALDTKSAFPRKITNQVWKCIGVYALQMYEDCGMAPAMFFHTEKNHNQACLSQGAQVPPPMDESDPDLPELINRRHGSILDFWDADYDRGSVVNDLCTQYGIDKWDIIVWLMTWLVMGKRTGVLDDVDLGMEIDPSSEEFMCHLLDMITYRKGYWGNLLAEGMARAVRALGKNKYGDTVYKGIISQVVPGLQLDIPISFESAWGHCFHWQGRGFQGSTPPGGYLSATLMLMTNTRDCQTNSHVHGTLEYMRETMNAREACSNRKVAENAFMGEIKAEMKECVTCCDLQSPQLYDPNMERDMLEAATGINMTEKELYLACERSKNLFRAILMRDSGRCRAQEEPEAYEPLQYPDSEGQTLLPEDFSKLVDHYYDVWGWDRKTGWPTRETWVRVGLEDVADTMDALGMLPE